MKILMVTSEAVPFAKTGGLADAVSALAINLRKQGHDVKIVMPRFYKIDRKKLKAIDEPVAVAATSRKTPCFVGLRVIPHVATIDDS